MKLSLNETSRALTNGTRLAMRELGTIRDVVGCNISDDHNLRGVVASTCTRKVETLRQALQISNDASCSSSVDVYQYVLPPSHAWFTAAAIAPRKRLSPAVDGGGAANDGIGEDVRVPQLQRQPRSYKGYL